MQHHTPIHSRMRRVPRFLPSLLVVGAAGVALLGGCERSGARAERTADRELTAVADDFRFVPTAGLAAAEPEQALAVRRQLEGLAQRAAAIDGSPGQNAAAALLGANIQNRMGRIALDRLRELHRQIRGDRVSLSGQVDAAILMDALADAGESFDPSRDRAALAALREDAKRRIAALEATMSELQAPIASTTQEIQAARDAVRELEMQEAKLRSEGQAMGPSAGFKYMLEAADVRSQANDRIIAAARDEVTLAELEPRYEYAAADARQQRWIDESLGRASDDLDALAGAARDLARGSRERLAALRTEIDQGLAAIDSLVSGPVAELLGQAEQDFEKAATLAQRAAGPDAGREAAQAARQAAATARQSLASLYATQALALRDHAALVARLASAGEALGDPAALERRLAELNTARDAAIEQAKAAVTAALEQVGQSGSATPEATALKSNLTEILAALEGKEPVIPVAGGGPGTAPPTASAGGGGFESPEQLLAFFQAADFSDPANFRGVGNAFRASTPPGKMTLSMMRSMIEDGADLIVAINERFGREGLAAAGMGGTGSIEWEKLAVGETSGNTATLIPTEPGAKPVPLVKAAGSWYVNLDELLAQQSGGAAGSMGSMPPGFADAMNQLRDAFRGVFASLAERVRAGEFSSPEQIEPAMQQAIMEKLMGGVPGNLQAPGS